VLADFLEVELTFMVFYDCEPRLSGHEAMKLIESTAQFLGYKPTNLHVQVAGKERRPLYKSALKLATDGSFDGYEYMQAVIYVKKGDVSSLKVSIGSDYGEIWRGNYASSFTVGFVEHPDRKFDPRDLIRVLTKYQKPGCGIYYRMPFKLAPGWFGGTVINLGLPKNLQERQQEFIEEYRDGRQREGKIRDVFKYNVLSNIHLNAWIEGKNLRSWIEDRMKGSVATIFGQTRGSLEEVVEGVWLWSLTDKEIQLVRPSMLKAGLLMVRA
jgi:hypothetical protein